MKTFENVRFKTKIIKVKANLGSKLGSCIEECLILCVSLNTVVELEFNYTKHVISKHDNIEDLILNWYL